MISRNLTKLNEVLDLVDENSMRQAIETLEELDWCLDQLETIQTHRSVSDMATSKVGHFFNIFKGVSMFGCNYAYNDESICEKI